jgi:hypothetical protein
MSTTSEIVFQLNFMAGAADEGFGSKYSDAKIFRAAAARLDELERENARMRADGKFLVDRLTDFERDGDVRTDDGQRDWDGHIKPALSRFRAALAGSGEK